MTDEIFELRAAIFALNESVRELIQALYDSM
jgi:hypothetical protein